MPINSESRFGDKESISVTVTKTRKRPVDIVAINSKTSYSTPLMSPIDSLQTGTGKPALQLEPFNNKTPDEEFNELANDLGM